MWRALAASVAAVAASLVPATPAAAQPHQIGWWLKASGSVQVVADANHIWGEGFDNQGRHIGRVFNYWWDWYCQLGTVTSGDNRGTPFRMWAVSPYGSGVSCLPNYGGPETVWSVYYGWRNGAGAVSGSNVYHPWYVAEHPVSVPLRPPHERGTLIEVY